MNSNPEEFLCPQCRGWFIIEMQKEGLCPNCWSMEQCEINEILNAKPKEFEDEHTVFKMPKRRARYLDHTHVLDQE